MGLIIWRLLKMFRMTKKIMFAAGLLAICSGQFDAYGSNINNDNNDRSHLAGHLLVVAAQGSSIQTPNALEAAQTPNALEAESAKVAVAPSDPILHQGRDVSGMIFQHICRETNPAILRLVCRKWEAALAFEKNDGQPETLIRPGLLLQQCIKSYWGGFSNAILCYTSPDDGALIEMNFQDLFLNPIGITRTFNLDNCGDIGRYVRMTLSWEEFVKARGKNADKVVTLFAMRHHMVALLEKLRAVNDPSAKDLADILSRWKDPAAILWRWGNDQKVLCDESFGGLDMVAGDSLFEKWYRALDLSGARLLWNGLGMNAFNVRL
jgi:hypothetical protein